MIAENREKVFSQTRRTIFVPLKKQSNEKNALRSKDQKEVGEILKLMKTKNCRKAISKFAIFYRSTGLVFKALQKEEQCKMFSISITKRNFKKLPKSSWSEFKKKQTTHLKLITKLGFC